MAAVETLAAKKAREDRENRAFLEKTPATALTAVRLMVPVIDKLKADSKNQLATSEEKIEKKIVESLYMILVDIFDLDDKIERLEHTVNCLGALLSAVIQELDPATFKRGTEGMAKSQRFVKEWHEDPGVNE